MNETSSVDGRTRDHDRPRDLGWIPFKARGAKLARTTMTESVHAAGWSSLGTMLESLGPRRERR